MLQLILAFIVMIVAARIIGGILKAVCLAIGYVWGQLRAPWTLQRALRLSPLLLMWAYGTVDVGMQLWAHYHPPALTAPNSAPIAAPPVHTCPPDQVCQAG